MARTPRQHRERNWSWLGGRRAAAQPYRESELAVDQPDTVIGPFPDGYDHAPPPDPPGPPVTHFLRSAGNWETLHTAPGASAATITTAGVLASELARVSGSSAPARQTWTGETTGIRIGLALEWDGLQHDLPIESWGSWDWALVTVEGQAYLLGRNDRGLQTGIRRLLYRLGYHMLTTAWEVLPSLGPNVAMVADDVGNIRLRFLQALGNSVLYPGEGQTRIDAWNARMGLINDGLWGTGHAWSQLKAAKLSLFDDSWQGGGLSGSGTKLCCYVPGLIAAAGDYAVAQFTPTNNRRCASMGASDGSNGWDLECSSTGEEVSKNQATRQAHLGSAAQVAVRTALGPDHHVSIQCYADTSSPGPTEAIDPDVLVLWTSGFVGGGLSPEQAVQGYFNQGAVLHSPYGYLSEWLWYQDVPCRDRATKRSELDVEAQRLTGLQYPATGLSGESSASWVPFGRWYWAIAGVYWGDDPLTRWDAWPAVAFPSATALAQLWYNVVDNPVPLSSDLVHRMADSARNLVRALPLGSAERERALDLGRWAIYTQLLRAYFAAPGALTLEPLLRWVFRDRHRDIVSYAAPYVLTTWATDRKAVAAKYGLSDLTYASNVWPDVPTSDAEVLAALDSAVATNALIPFDTVEYSDADLVRVSGLTHTSTTPGAYVAQVKDQVWWYHSTTGTDIWTFQAGLVRNDSGSVRVQVIDFATGEIMWDQSLPPDKVVRATNNPAQLPPVVVVPQRIYNVVVTNAKPGLKMTTSSGGAVVIPLTDDLAVFTASYQGYVYVPKGTTKLGFFAQSGTIRLTAANNVDQPIYSASDTLIGPVLVASNGYYYASVNDDTDGQLWRVHSPSNKFRPYTIPRQLCADPADVLLPRDVVVADGLTLADQTPPPTPQFPTATFSSVLVKPTVTFANTGPAGFVNYEGFDGTAYTIGTGASVDYTLQGGIVSNQKGNATITVVDTVTSLQVAQWVSAPDKVVRTFSFTGVLGRVYRLLVDNNGGCKLAAATGVPLVWETVGRSQLSMPFTGGYNMYCYVPKGTTHAEGWFDAGTVKVYDNANKLVTTFTAVGGYYSWAIPTGKDGTVFRLVALSKRCGFTNIPPYLSLTPGSLLVPEDVAAADGL